ncbi:MAG: hypothetical protein HY320_01045, partial [Armatimonadetes bacterium]|nr:hypothetical protein [Armatimonadota bacterium]
PQPTIEDLLAEVDDQGSGGEKYSWFTRLVKDGRYRLKIVATDALTCPDEPLTAAVISDVFIVDNTGPKVLKAAAQRVGIGPPTVVRCADDLSPIVSVEYRVKGTGEWRRAAPQDGIYDSLNEAARIDPAVLLPGRRVLEIRVRDAAGNTTIDQLVYVLKFRPR